MAARTIKDDPSSAPAVAEKSVMNMGDFWRQTVFERFFLIRIRCDMRFCDHRRQYYLEALNHFISAASVLWNMMAQIPVNQHSTLRGRSRGSQEQ